MNRYAEEFLEFTDRAFGLPNSVPDWLPPWVKCTVTSIQYQLEPFIHCIIELSTDVAQYSPADFGLSANAAAAPDSRALILSETNERLSANSVKLTVRFHPSDEPDFIVLQSRFEQALQRDWQQGTKFRMLYGGSSPSDGGWFHGNVIAVERDAPEFPWESLHVGWETEEYTEYVSPWEVQTIDPSSNEPQLSLVEAINPQLASAVADEIRTKVLLVVAVMIDCNRYDPSLSGFIAIDCHPVCFASELDPRAQVCFASCVSNRRRDHPYSALKQLLSIFSASQVPLLSIIYRANSLISIAAVGSS